MMKRIGIIAAILALAGCGRNSSMTRQPIQPEYSPGVGLRKIVSNAMIFLLLIWKSGALERY
jgi:hypothetical protein